MRQVGLILRLSFGSVSGTTSTTNAGVTLAFKHLKDVCSSSWSCSRRKRQSTGEKLLPSYFSRRRIIHLIPYWFLLVKLLHNVTDHNNKHSTSPKQHVLTGGMSAARHTSVRRYSPYCGSPATPCHFKMRARLLPPSLSDNGTNRRNRRVTVLAWRKVSDG